MEQEQLTKPKQNEPVIDKEPKKVIECVEPKDKESKENESKENESKIMKREEVLHIEEKICIIS